MNQIKSPWVGNMKVIIELSLNCFQFNSEARSQNELQNEWELAVLLRNLVMKEVWDWYLKHNY